MARSDADRTATLSGRRAAAIAAALAVLAAPLTGPGARAEQKKTQSPAAREVVRGPALTWRFLRGPRVQGAMALIDPNEQQPPTPAFWRRAVNAVAPKPDAEVARGRFVLNVEGRGVFIGLYTVREDGRSLVGAFWPEDADPTDPIAGTLDVGAAPDDRLAPDEGRVVFLDGTEFTGLRAD